MRSDLLSKRLYYLGCLGLPWLWIVHVLYSWQIIQQQQREQEQTTLSEPTSNNRDDDEEHLDNNDNHNDNMNRTNRSSTITTAASSTIGAGLINPDDHFHDEPTSMTPEQIQMDAMKWMNRCKYSAIVVVMGWIAWIVVVQVLRDQLPAQLFMLSPDSPQLTGW